MPCIPGIPGMPGNASIPGLGGSGIPSIPGIPGIPGGGAGNASILGMATGAIGATAGPPGNRCGSFSFNLSKMSFCASSVLPEMATLAIPGVMTSIWMSDCELRRISLMHSPPLPIKAPICFSGMSRYNRGFGASSAAAPAPTHCGTSSLASFFGEAADLLRCGCAPPLPCASRARLFRAS